MGEVIGDRFGRGMGLGEGRVWERDGFNLVYVTMIMNLGSVRPLSAEKFITVSPLLCETSPPLRGNCQ
jgi:hypothetical protein